MVFGDQRAIEPHGIAKTFQLGGNHSTERVDIEKGAAVSIQVSLDPLLPVELRVIPGGKLVEVIERKAVQLRVAPVDNPNLIVLQEHIVPREITMHNPGPFPFRRGQF